METFRALVVDQRESGVAAEIRQLRPADLPQPDGGLLIRVSYSSMNYKDALACTEGGQVVRCYPIAPGIDLAGKVVESADPRFAPGDPVVATGYGLGVSRHGGYSELARVPAEWAVPLPPGLTEREAMILGTAGFTAALSVRALSARGVAPDDGPVLVTGATGGVGSLAVAMLAKLGFEVAAATGKSDRHARLRELGASHIVPREELLPASARLLEKQLWAGAVDCVGGPALAYILASTKYGGTVTACGLTGGSALPATVFPFILRGVSLIGIDSVMTPMAERLTVWSLLAGKLKPPALASMCREIALEDVPALVRAFLEGRSEERVLVKL